MRLTKISSMADLVEHFIKDLYSAENQIIEALPDVIDNVTSSRLAEALTSHLNETQVQVKRLEEAAELLDIRVSGEECKGVKGLLEESNHAIKNIEKGELLDSVLAGGCRKVEHYEILGYMELIKFMTTAGLDRKAIQLMEETLAEEENADQKLTGF